jgi:Outer membrane protein and related peptidoglycan-associated (lipo)proteins
MKNFVLIACVVISSCNTVRSVKSNMDARRVQLENMLNPIDSLDRKRAEKLEKGELDEKTDSIVRAYIARLKDSIAIRLQRFDVLASNLGDNKKAAIAYLNSVKDAYKKELDNILFFDDLFDASTFSRLNTAAFFAPGEYLPEETTYTRAKAIMDQILDDAMTFANRYKKKKLQAMFVVTGYADEEAILPGSSLYESLVASVSNTDRKVLNRELSTRRATAIRDILKKEYYLLDKKHQAKNLTANFLAIGKGEALPQANIKDYKAIDERRRVVLMYWSMVPEL